MYGVPKSSGSIYSTEDSNEANNGCNSDSSDSDTQQLLESPKCLPPSALSPPPDHKHTQGETTMEHKHKVRMQHHHHPESNAVGRPGSTECLSQGKKSSCSCTNSHPLFSHKWKYVLCPCPPKKSITKLICNLIVLSLKTPFCLLKGVCSILSRVSSTQKILSWVILFLLFFGATYMGLLDGNKFQMFGEAWRDFSICDLIQGETKDLRSLIKANHSLGKKTLENLRLKEQVGKLQSELHDLRLGMKDIAHHAVSEVLEGYTSKGSTRWSIEKMLKKLMEKLDEDDVQMPDYALRSAGASIVQSRTTRSYRHDGGKYFWMSFIMLPFVKSPDVILQPNYHPGNCWSFPGNRGETVVRLAKEIIPRAVTIEHISKKVSPTGEISSAPKDFAIYGLQEEKEEQGTFLGQFLYDTEGDLIQTFQLKNESSEFMSYVKLNVLNNWGHPNYTCIYRFRVHGDLQYN
ncbi:SUN domain-containing protein 3 isoform X2 [Rhineura floridana]|uniref:SUN domain-containing protein 3 isoform X2 n=1 Tax=Rhineura floridana TaxID=261503 RepID=UPI002AC888E4|nr:SUN domain-containing protein 3 isoform X2 [Rhineura floridana]